MDRSSPDPDIVERLKSLSSERPLPEEEGRAVAAVLERVYEAPRRVGRRAAAASVLAACGAIAFFLQVKGTGPVVARVVSAGGNVRPVEGSGTFILAGEDHLDLHRGVGKVQVQGIGRASVRLLQEEARGGIALVLDRGGIDCRVEPGTPFRILTPAGEAQVRGTEFRIAVFDLPDGLGSVAAVSVRAGVVEIVSVSGGRAERLAAGVRGILLAREGAYRFEGEPDEGALGGAIGAVTSSEGIPCASSWVLLAVYWDHTASRIRRLAPGDEGVEAIRRVLSSVEDAAHEDAAHEDAAQ